MQVPAMVLIMFVHACVGAYSSLVETLGIGSKREDYVREYDDLIVTQFMMSHQKLTRWVCPCGHVTGSS